ncbi:MAG TPA: hypothetical protein VF290_02660 [Pyrinomonadaceae bacterium]
MSLPLFEQVFAGEPEPTDRPLTGAELRDSGMASVLSHTPEEFKERFARRVEGFPRGYRFTMDRVVDELGGRPADVHPNAIGALTSSMVKRSLIKRTGVMLKGERASLHRTDMPEWERL